jgi:hypothetical protein
MHKLVAAFLAGVGLGVLAFRLWLWNEVVRRWQ